MTPQEFLNMNIQMSIDVIKEKLIEAEKEYPLNLAFKLAIKALDKQLPKKPVYLGYSIVFECPCCKGRMSKLVKPDCCLCCGQKLDWRE